MTPGVNVKNVCMPNVTWDMLAAMSQQHILNLAFSFQSRPCTPMPVGASDTIHMLSSESMDEIDTVAKAPGAPLCIAAEHQEELSQLDRQTYIPRTYTHH